jgi:cytochrome P450
VKAVYDKPDGDSMISTILSNEKVPSTEKELERMADELKFLIIAGSDAPSQVMAITLFHLLWNPETCQKLKAELDEAFPVVADADWTQLKNLPYLVRHISPIVSLQIVLTIGAPVCCVERGSTTFRGCDNETSA